MKQEIIIAGFGGQGVLSMGKILAYSGLMEGKEVSYRLEPLPLAQMAAAVDGKGATGHVATVEQVVDQVNHLFFAWCDFHQ